MLKHSAIEIWSKIPLEMKNKQYLTLSTAKYTRNVLLGY